MKEKYTLDQKIDAILNSPKQQARLETRHDFFAFLIERIQKKQVTSTPKIR